MKYLNILEIRVFFLSLLKLFETVINTFFIDRSEDFHEINSLLTEVYSDIYIYMFYLFMKLAQLIALRMFDRVLHLVKPIALQF